MPNLSNRDVALGQNFWESSATQKHPLGTRGYTADGRAFRYALAGASDLIAGNSIQSPAIVANHLGTTAVASSLGALVQSTALGATAAAANLYAEGYLDVDTTPGNGYVYTVKDHLAILSSGTGAFNLLPDDGIQVALTTASRVGLLQNLYSGVIQTPITTATGIVVGMAPYIIKATQYGWIQTYGIGAVLINGTPALGATVIGVSASTAGSLDVATAVTILTGQIFGVMAQVGVSGKNNFVDIRIRP